MDAVSPDLVGKFLIFSNILQQSVNLPHIVHAGFSYHPSVTAYNLDSEKAVLWLYLLFFVQMNHRLLLLHGPGLKTGDDWIGGFQQTLPGPDPKKKHPEKYTEADYRDRADPGTGQFELYFGLPPFLLGCHLTSVLVR